MKPQRIQLRRTKGWRMPPNTVKVDRTTQWGNPFRVVEVDCIEDAWYMPASPEAAVNYFRRYLKSHPGLVREAKRFLRGKNLACWCKPGAPCHADVWLKLVNR